LNFKKKCKFALIKETKKKNMSALFLFLVFIAILALIFVVVKVIGKSENANLKKILSVVFVLLSVVFLYLIYASVQEPIEFEKLKEKRYKAAVEKFIEIKTVQQAYKTKYNKYTHNLDSLIAFIENEEFIIIERKDTSYADVEKNNSYGIKEGYMIDDVIKKEIGRVKIKDSLFKNSDRYKELDVVKIPGLAPLKIKMESGMMDYKDSKVPVFKASLKKDLLLSDQKKDLVTKENKSQSVEGINGLDIVLGSMEEVNLSGNWPKKYGKNE
jgi:hypothetical protein